MRFTLMIIKNFRLASALLAVLIGIRAAAEDASSPVTGQPVAAPSATLSASALSASPPVSKRLMVFTIFETGSTLQREGDTSRKASTSLEVRPSLRVAKDVRINASATLDRAWDASQTTQFENSRISLGYYGLHLTNGFDLIPRLSSVAPTNDLANRTDGFQGAGGLGTRLTFDFERFGLPVSGFYDLSGDQNVHSYTFSADGTANLQYVARQSLYASIPLGGKFSFALSGGYTTGWTYRGVARSTFEAAQDLSYEVQPGAYAYVGHTNSGNASKPGGRETNVKIYDDDVSLIRAGVLVIW